MKAKIKPQYSKRELEAISKVVDKQVVESISKAQWIMLVALNEALGIGEQRILKVMELYPKLLEEYEGCKRDDAADEMLARRVKQILPNSFTRLYPNP